MSGYDATAAGVLRQALGQPAAPSDYERRFSAELPEREQAARRFAEAWGFADGRGLATERGWRRAELRAVHQAHAAGQQWVGPLSDADVATIVRRMRVAREADAIAARAAVAGPPGMSPAEVAAWRRTAGPVAGVAGPS